MPASSSIHNCRIMARACSEAVALDVSIPRPGLFSLQRPRRPGEERGFISIIPRSYEVCLCSCLRGYRRRGGWSDCWASGVVDIARRGFGNPGFGSLFLLALLSSSLGRAVESGSGRVEGVMGWSRRLVEAEGARGAFNFYRALAAANPSYLFSISWSGLPDASRQGLALGEVERLGLELREIVDKASIYDPVMRDASRFLALSLGIVYPLLREEVLEKGEGLWGAVKEATYTVALLEGDLILARGDIRVEDSLLEASSDGGVFEALLWRLLRGTGPGSVADVVISGLAYFLYEEFEKGGGGASIALYPWRR